MISKRGIHARDDDTFLRVVCMCALPPYISTPSQELFAHIVVVVVFVVLLCSHTLSLGGSFSTGVSFTLSALLYLYLVA